MVEGDFAGNKVSLKDVNVGYKMSSAPVKLVVGNQKHAISMEIEESSNDIMFTERSLVAALTTPYFDRALGVTAASSGSNWHLKTGLFGDGVSSGDADEGNGFGLRGSFAPVLDGDRIVHLGATYGYRKVSDDGLANGKSPSFSYKTSNFSDLKPVNAAVADMESVQLNVLELAAMMGKWSLQSEIAQNKIEREVGEDLSFSAQYVQLGYTLFGGQRKYKASEGEFKHLKVESGGALELAVRLDQIDLEDEDISGGKAKRATLALNWYPNDTVRVMLDYTHSFDLEGGAIQDSSGQAADQINTLAARLQWAF